MKAMVCCTGEFLERTLDRAYLQWVIDQSEKRPICVHSEAVWLQPHCQGLTVDLGCGHEKVHPSVLGIDILRPGEMGATGCMNGVESSADIVADVGNLYFIADGTFDSVVSRHCFEHLKDPIATLREWLRILKPGGLLSMVLPHDGWHDMMGMDSSHYFRCYPSVIADAMESLGNYGGKGIRGEIVENGAHVQCRWSFFSQIRRLEPLTAPPA